MMDIRLKVFRSVAVNLSFTKASQELYISQPAISKHIQELEQEYHVRLFDRLGNRIQLTRAGKLLLDHAERISEDYRRMEDDLNALQHKVQGELRLGASTTISQYVIPEILATFLKRYPHLKVTLLSGNSREIEAALCAGQIDIGMVEGVVRQPQLKYTAFMKDELVAMVSTKGALAGKEELTLEELKTVPLVFRERGSGTLEVIERALHRHQIRLTDLDIVMSFGTTEGIKHFVEHSDCMGIVSVQSIARELLAGLFRVVEIRDFSMERDFAFVEKRGETLGLQETWKRFITNGYRAL